jgi:RluA family pseudouridine synthase
VTSSEKRPLLDWVLARFPDTPKRRAKEWIVTGRIRVGGMPAQKPLELFEDPADSLQLVARHAHNQALTEPLRIHPRVTLLYLDKALAVVVKGAGILAVPSGLPELSALSVLKDFLAGALRPCQRAGAAQHAALAGLRQLRPLPVHRLDRYTSGVMCMAMNPRARAHLIEQFRSHGVTRQYVAFVDGRLETRRGLWRHWLWGKEGEIRQRVLSEHESKPTRAQAVEAVTTFEVLREFQVAPRRVVTKLRLTLETGRTHQIRAQAAAQGVPLIGERFYRAAFREARRKDEVGQAPEQQSLIEFDRQALHAELLALTHPDAPHQRLEWRAPLPSDLVALELRLRQMEKQQAALTNPRHPRIAKAKRVG